MSDAELDMGPAPTEIDYFVNDGESFVLPVPLPPAVISAGGATGVYCIRGGGLVKIGVARCVHRRLADLMAASPVALVPVGFIPTPESYRDAFAVERALHARFAALRAHHEWFHEAPALTAFMEAHLDPWPVPNPH